MDVSIRDTGVIPATPAARRLAEEQDWRTESPSPDHVGDALDRIGFPTDRHDYVVLTAHDDGYSVRFTGDEDRRVPVERPSFTATARGVAAREYGLDALGRTRRPFVPAEDVGEEYDQAVRLFNPDMREVSERFDHPISTTPEQGPHSDHWQYVKHGVPGYHVTSETGS
ncbi:MAG: hypothetical protein SVU88_04040, partial [Candidatus Nanohaloarchaea archaeon]|nr:hypothetical protein [Candidatus Nanohaloarchaea archaeon]